MKKTRVLAYVLIAIISVFALTACGGGGGGETALPTVAQPGISVSPDTGLVTSETSGPAGTAVISVKLKTAPCTDVTLDIASLTPTEVSVSPSTLTFTTLNWSDTQDVTLIGVDDDLIDGNQSVDVTIDPSGSACAIYAALPAVTITVQNSDNDAPGVTVSKDTAATTEDGGTDTFTVGPNTQPAPGEIIVMTVFSTDEGEVTVNPKTLVFTNASYTAQEVTVTGENDDMVDGPQDVNITIEIDPDATTADEYDAEGPFTVTVNNADNDVAGFTFSTAAVTVTEGGGTDSFTVQTKTQPADGEEVIVTITNGDPTEATIDKDTLVFTIGNWPSAQTVQVTAVDDANVDGTQSLDLTFDASTSTAAEYSGLTIAPVSITVMDNDNLTAEGTIADPVDITSDRPHAGTVDTGISRYKVTGLTAGVRYMITLTGLSDDAGLYVYDIDSTYGEPVACDPENLYKTGTEPEDCTLAAGGTEMYFEVDGFDTAAGSSFTVDVQPVPVIDITDNIPYAGTVDKGYSYYKITGLWIGASYTISMTGLSDDADLYLYDKDGSFTRLATCVPDNTGNGSTADEDCTISASGTEMYLKVDGYWTAAGADYTLDYSLNTRTVSVPDTGQTTCYESIGVTTNCTGTGQDGEFSINPMSFTNNLDGTITDDVTGLMWQKCVMGQNNDEACSGTAALYNWYEASGIIEETYNPLAATDVCGDLVMAGYSDWRLPTIKEMFNLLDYTGYSPVFDSTYFPNGNFSYWAITQSGAPSTLSDFAAGYVDVTASPINPSRVRCVRGNTPPSSYTDNSNGTVTDNITGLMWQKCSSGQTNDATCTGTPSTFFYQGVVDYCNTLSLGGYDDWRLANIKEIFSILNPDRKPDSSGPFLDPTYFPNITFYPYFVPSTSIGGGEWLVPPDGSIFVFIGPDSYGMAKCVR